MYSSPWNAPKSQAATNVQRFPERMIHWCTCGLNEPAAACGREITPEQLKAIVDRLDSGVPGLLVCDLSHYLEEILCQQCRNCIFEAERKNQVFVDLSGYIWHFTPLRDD